MKLSVLASFLLAAGSTSAADEDKIALVREFPSRIVGGTVAEDGEFPFYTIPGFGSNSCGAVLIHPDIILTAAHCQGLWERAETVHIGMNSVTGVDATETIHVESEHNHPGYNDFTLENDIALIKLQTASAVDPASWNSDSSLPVDNDELVVCGFGTTTSGGSSSDVLLKVTVNAVNSDTCVAQYFGEVFPDQMLCAAAPGKDSCQGDS